MSIRTSFNPLGTLGSGLPSGYKLVESVYFDGSTYVDTGIVAKDAPLYRTDITAVVNPNRLSLIGSNGSGALPMAFIGLRANSTIYAGLNAGFGGNVSYNKKRCIWEFAENGVYVDGQKVYSNGFTSSSKNWLIMACYYGGYYEMKGTFYGLTLRNKDNELVAQYLPVYNSVTNEYLLWETVSKTPVRATKGQIKGVE